MSEDIDSLIDESKQTDDWGGLVEDEPEETMMVVRFTTEAGMRYAVDGYLVREIIGQSMPTPLPGAPSHIRGIIVHRRQVIGVLDLERWFHLSRRGTVNPESIGRFLLLESKPYTVAVPAVIVSSVEPWHLRGGSARDIIDDLSDRLKNYAMEVEMTDGESTILLDFKALLEDAAVR